MKFIAFLKSIVFLFIGIVLFFSRKFIFSFTNQFTDHQILAPTVLRILITFCIIEALRLMIIAFYKPSNPKLKRDNFIIGIGHLSKIIYGSLVVVLILSLFNISVKEAITTLSLIAAAIVLMTKDYINNLINGMYLTFAKVITIGDQVQIETIKGKILDITLTNVHLLNDDDDIIYIPNNKVFSSDIINYTRRELKKSNLDFEIENELLYDADVLQQEITDSLGNLQQLIQPGTLNLKVQSRKFEYTQFKFQFILINPLNKEDDRKIRRHVIRFIVRRTAELRKNGR